MHGGFSIQLPIVIQDPTPQVRSLSHIHLGAIIFDTTHRVFRSSALGFRYFPHLNVSFVA